MEPTLAQRLIDSAIEAGMSDADIAALCQTLDDMTLQPPRTETTGLMMDAVRQGFMAHAAVIIGACPASRERSLAITNLEQSLFWAIAALARHQEDTDE